MAIQATPTFGYGLQLALGYDVKFVHFLNSIVVAKEELHNHGGAHGGGDVICLLNLNEPVWGMQIVMPHLHAAPSLLRN